MAGSGERDLDVVVMGATGFVGRLVAAHLAAHGDAGVRVALAGRSPHRLAAVRAGLGARAASWPLVVVDSADDAALARLAASTRVVATTVGPYARHGLPLVLACARAGTHCADLTGEVLFHRRSIDAADDLARASGARIVHSCGFDAVPSDLGVVLVAAAACAGGAGPLVEAEMRLVSARGGVSGGTVDSLRVQLDAVRADPAARALVADRHALSPDAAAEPAPRQPADLPRPHRAPDGAWLAPYVMAPYNTRVVRRSNALLGHAWGRSLRYREVVAVPGRASAWALAAGTAALAGALAVPALRPATDRVLPAPGAGPDERTRAAGGFTVQVRALAADGSRWRSTLSMAGDPGYAATAVMLGESALALALDGDRLPDLPDRPGAGVLTPATAIGPALVARLAARGAGLGVERALRPTLTA